MLRLGVMYDFFMKEVHFSQQIINIRTISFMNNHWQRACYRMVNSVCGSDAEGADATPLWNTGYIKKSLAVLYRSFHIPGTDSQNHIKSRISADFESNESHGRHGISVNQSNRAVLRYSKGQLEHKVISW
jgi:hypothetical protein